MALLVFILEFLQLLLQSFIDFIDRISGYHLPPEINEQRQSRAIRFRETLKRNRFGL